MLLFMSASVKFLKQFRRFRTTIKTGFIYSVFFYIKKSERGFFMSNKNYSKAKTNNKSYKNKKRKADNEKMKEVFKTLQDGVKDVFSSEAYKKYLDFLSMFHNYSLNNTLLILFQMPSAVRVASKATWEKAGFKLLDNVQGINVIVPVEHKQEETVIIRDTNGNPVVDTNGEVQTRKEERVTTSFKVGKVYDISQTDGKLPTLSHELTENSPVLQKAISDIIKNSYEVKIRFDERLTANDCNGYYSPKFKSISLRANMSSAQTFKTLIHELAHSYLHNNTGNEYDRSKEEVEAESVAYSVCHCFGLDTSDYSFGYIASWSSDKNLKELKSSLNRIKSAVDKISEWVCNSTDLTYNTA